MREPRLSYISVFVVLWGLSFVAGTSSRDAGEEWVQPAALGDFDGVAFVKLSKVGGTTLHQAITDCSLRYNYTICEGYYPCGDNITCVVETEPPTPRTCNIWTTHGARNVYLDYGVKIMERWVPNQLRLVILRDPIEHLLSHTYYSKYGMGRRGVHLVTKKSDVTGLRVMEIYLGRRGGMEAALENMEKNFHIVGVTERMDEVITLICLYMGWDPALAPMENLHVSHRRPALKDHNKEVQEHILRWTRDEYVLYHKAHVILDRLIRQIPKKTWERALGRFRAANAEALDPITHPW